MNFVSLKWRFSGVHLFQPFLHSFCQQIEFTFFEKTSSYTWTCFKENLFYTFWKFPFSFKMLNIDSVFITSEIIKRSPFWFKNNKNLLNCVVLFYPCCSNKWDKGSESNKTNLKKVWIVIHCCARKGTVNTNNRYKCSSASFD